MDRVDHLRSNQSGQLQSVSHGHIYLVAIVFVEFLHMCKSTSRTSAYLLRKEFGGGMHGMSQMQAQAGRDGFIHGSADHACTSLLLRKPGVSKGTHTDHTPPTNHEYHYSPSNRVSRGVSI